MEFTEVGAWVAYFGAEKTVELVPKAFWVFLDVGIEGGADSEGGYFVSK